jgi:DNA-binding response OmpR family regulator
MDEKKKVFLVEDDHYINRAYRDGLSRAGFEVEVAHDGKEAVEKLKTFTPNLILLDVLMPSMNGFEVLEEIRLNEKLKDTPVIIVSNLSQGTDVEKAKALGVVDYLIKSDFSMKDIIEKVKFYFAKQ